MKIWAVWGMPGRRTCMVGLALVAGLAAAWAARQYLMDRVEQLEAQARVPTVQRVVAAFDLSAGTRLNAEYVAVRDIPVQWAPSTSLSPESFIEHTDAVLAQDIKRGDAILAPQLLDHREPTLAERLKDGRRAVTLPVDDMSSQSGMLQPGDRIDLYVSFVHRGKQMTAPLLQRLMVLAVGRQADPTRTDGQGFATVTLDASPEEAVKLVAAREAGTLTAILRRQHDDRSDFTAARGDLASLLGMIEKPKPARRDVPILYGDGTGLDSSSARGSTSDPSKNAGQGSASQGVFQLGGQASQEQAPEWTGP